MPVRIISEEDFKGWWANPVGQEVRAMLMERVSKINDQALNQEVIRDAVTCAVFLGRKLEIQDLLNMSYQELMGEE